MKRYPSVLMLFAIVTMVLSACGTTASPPASQPAADSGTSASAETIQLQFMGWGSPSEQQVFQTLIDKYQQSNPNVQVEYILVPPGEFLQKLTTLAAADELPDVFYMGSDWFSAWVTKDIMLPIEDYIDAAELEKTWPRARDLYRYDGTQVGTGKVYALPKDLGPWVMVYNKDLFDKHGVAYPPSDRPWTWEEALDAWQKMTVENSDGTFESFGVGDYSVEAAVWSNGGDFLNAERTAVTVDDPKFTDALQYVVDLRCEHHVSPTETERASLNTYEMWVKGMVGTHVMGPWDQPVFWDLPFEWDIAPFPAGPGTGEAASWTGSMGFGVSAKTAHPEEAADLARFFSLDQEGQKTNFELGQAVPNLVEMAKGEFLAMEKAPASRQVFLDNIESWGRPTLGWYTSNDQWIDTMWQEMAPVWQCERSAADWGAEWGPKLTETLNREPQVPAILP